MNKPNETPVESVNPLAVRQGGAPIVLGGGNPPATPTPANKILVVEGMGLEGDFNVSDIKIPRVNVVQGVGPLSADWEPGTILFAREAILGKAGQKDASKEFDLTIVKVRKEYEENLPFEEMEGAMRVQKEEEVYAQGGTLKYGSRIDEKTGKEVKVKPTWRPVAQMLLFIRKPDGLESSLFGHEIKSDPDNAFHPWEEGEYAIAIIGAKGTSYGMLKDATAAYGRLVKQEKPLLYQSWSFSVKRELKGENLVFVPKLRTNRIHSDAFASYVSEQVAGLPI